MRKGFTLIEAAVAAALVGILISAQGTVLARYIRGYNETVQESSDAFYAEQAFVYIGYITEHSESANAGSGTIELVRRDGLGSDWIKLDKAGDLVISYGSPESGTANRIMKGLAAFEAERRGLVVFVTLRTKKGNEYKRCFFLKVKKEGASSSYILS
jgi:prepilin-type N-terminal cleavage/methylation domain-containing protein